MNISVSTQTEFVPKWNGNDGLPEGERIVVFHHTPSIALYEQLIPKASLVLKIDTEGKAAGGETEMQIDTAALVRKMVTSIKNLTFVLDGKQEIQIKKVEDLFSGSVPAIASGLVDEIGSYLQGLLTKKGIDPKN